MMSSNRRTGSRKLLLEKRDRRDYSSSDDSGDVEALLRHHHRRVLVARNEAAGPESGERKKRSVKMAAAIVCVALLGGLIWWEFGRSDAAGGSVAESPPSTGSPSTQGTASSPTSESLSNPWPSRPEIAEALLAANPDASRDPPADLLSFPPTERLQAAKTFFRSQVATKQQDGVTWDATDGRPVRPQWTDANLGSWIPPSVVFSNGGMQPGSPTTAGSAAPIQSARNRKRAPQQPQQREPPQAAVQLPKFQLSSTADDNEVQAARREWVRRAFLHSWEGYKRAAWGSDEVKPVSGSFHNAFNGWGATIIDTLDTLLILNLSHEYNLARPHVHAVDFSFLVPSHPDAIAQEADDGPAAAAATPSPVPAQGQAVPQRRAEADLVSPSKMSFFETTIRYLGGLLSAYDLSGDALMLQRAQDLGDWLLPAFNTKHGLPVAHYTMGFDPEGAPEKKSPLADVGSNILEFTRLSMLTGDPKYFHAAQRAIDTLDTHFPPSEYDDEPAGALLPIEVDAENPEDASSGFTLGALADSFYEYLIKQVRLTHGGLPQHARMYSASADSALEYLVKPVKTIPGHADDFLTVGALVDEDYSLEMEHLTCFAGGMFALGSRVLGRASDFSAAEKITNLCVWLYDSSPSGVGAEGTTFFEEGDPERALQPANAVKGIKSQNPVYISRPETIESVFYMYRATGNPEWQEKGWKMFLAWVDKAFAPFGLSSLEDTDTPDPVQSDNMQSFVFAETFKYYYLLFAPTSFISLDDYVFNTEAHPFLITSNRPPQLLWTGPDPATTYDFQAPQGGGSTVQLWARVNQAAA